MFYVQSRPGTYFLDQAGLEITEIHLPFPLSARINFECYHAWYTLPEFSYT